MFGSIGGPEMVVLLIIALLVFGPRRLPDLARGLGKGLSQLKRASHDFRSTLEREVRQAEHQETIGAPVPHPGGGEVGAGAAEAPALRPAPGSMPRSDAGQDPGAGAAEISGAADGAAGEAAGGDGADGEGSPGGPAAG